MSPHMALNRDLDAESWVFGDHEQSFAPHAPDSGGLDLAAAPYWAWARIDRGIDTEGTPRHG